MMCQNCGENEANVRYTQIINGVKKEINVCDNCAKELGLNSFEFNMPIHFSDFLGDFFSNYDNELLPSFAKESNNLCSNCGKTYDEFIKTGLLGCANDYDKFNDKIDLILKKLQGNNRHIGRGVKNSIVNNIDSKNVKQIIADNTKDGRINKLQEDLKLAIKDERYEDAAKIRDEIKKIESNK